MQVVGVEEEVLVQVVEVVEEVLVQVVEVVEEVLVLVVGHQPQLSDGQHRCELI